MGKERSVKSRPQSTSPTTGWLKKSKLLILAVVTKHDVTVVQHRIFSHGNIIRVTNFPVLDCSQNDKMFNARTIV